MLADGIIRPSTSSYNTSISPVGPTTIDEDRLLPPEIVQVIEVINLATEVENAQQSVQNIINIACTASKQTVWFHDDPTAGHPGADETIRTIRRHYFWPKLSEDVCRHVFNESIRPDHTTKYFKLQLFYQLVTIMDKSEKYRHRFMSYDETMNQSNDSYLACELKKKMARPSVGCDIIFDSVLCWPQTPPNTLAVLPCFSQLNGIHYDTTNNASRFCLPNGTWDQYTDYSNCKELIDEEHDDEMTTKIYFIGYTISLVGLLIAVYIFCRFKDLRCLRNSIHMNLMISYILADFVWVLTYAIPISVSTKKTSCIFLVLLLHYFHLTNFFWMFIEGLYLYILVVKTFSGEHIKLRIYLIIGWGGPVLFVLFWGTAKSFTVPTDDQQSSGIRNCPWTYHVLDWIYQTPAMLLLVTNLIFLIIIMWVLITKLRSANNAETQQYRKAAKALLVLIPLLGVTHILVLVGPTHGLSKRIYEYVRAVLLSTQGFTVALFYCFLNMEVKNTLKHHFNSWHTTRSLGSRRSRYSSRDWSPRSRDSLRLYQGSFFKKRESTCSVGTTTTLVSVPVGGKTNSQQVRSPLLSSGDTG